MLGQKMNMSESRVKPEQTAPTEQLRIFYNFTPDPQL